MDIPVTTQTLSNVSSDALLIGAARKTTSQGKKDVLLSTAASTIDEVLHGLIQQRCTDGEFKGNLGEIMTIHPAGRLAVKRVIVVGLGAQVTITTQSLRRASAIALRHLQNTGAHHVTMALQQEGTHFDDSMGVQAQVEGAILGLYSFRMYQHSESNEKNISQIDFLADEAHKLEVEHAIYKGRALAEATNFARDLVNEPSNVLTPTEMANRASAMAKQFGLECEIFDQAKVTELGMGGLL